MRVNARALVNQEKSELFISLPPRLTVIFEDGVEIETTDRKVQYSRYFWDIHRVYTNTPILSTHFVEHVLDGKALTPSTHSKLLSIIFDDATKAHNLHTPAEKEHLLEMLYQITNDIHNEVSKVAEEYVASVDILDFIGIVENSSIKEAMAAIEPDKKSIKDGYGKLVSLLNNSPEFQHNPLVKAIRSGIVNSNQVLQCVGVRGFPSEVDGMIFKTPILTNYTKGFNNLYSFAADSRSAAKSLYFSEAPLQDAEYFARRLQLLSMTVERIDYSDCGTTQYLQWRIMPPTKDEHGNTTYPGDLVFMIGKYYLNEETNGLKEITFNDHSLYNKVLKIRSVIFCKHPNPHSVCEVCFGALSKNVSQYANIGHLCSATMTQQTSQSVLSTKHLDASSVSANIMLGEADRKYLTTNKAKNAYIIKKELKDKNLRIVVNREEVPGLVDILNIDNVDNINPIRVSEVKCIELVYTTKTEEVTAIIFVNQDNRKAIFTSEFLKYLKVRRWETDGRNNFVFDLDGWDYNLPFLKLPDMEYSYSDHSHQIARIIESNMKNITERATPHSPIATLQELFSLVNTKLNVNIACLEIIVYATMLPNKDEYALSRNKTDPVMGIAALVIKNRSLSAAYAYQGQSETITSPRSFFRLDRPSSILDVFIAPNEVVAEYKNK